MITYKMFLEYLRNMNYTEEKKYWRISYSNSEEGMRKFRRDYKVLYFNGSNIYEAILKINEYLIKYRDGLLTVNEMNSLYDLKQIEEEYKVLTNKDGMKIICENIINNKKFKIEECEIPYVFSEKLKIATLNVYNLEDDIKINHIVKQIIYNDIHIVGFQEISLETTKKIAKELKYEYVYHKNVAIVSIHKIDKIEKIDLSYDRSAIKIKIEKRNTVIVCTHLDHKNEEKRLLQLKEIELSDVDFLIGDFNSLIFSDYTFEELKEISKKRKEDNWESIKEDLIEEILRLGFKTMPMTIPTCRFKTKIDYIFTKNSSIIEYVINFTNKSISDHEMVVNISDY